MKSGNRPKRRAPNFLTVYLYIDYVQEKTMKFQPFIHDQRANIFFSPYPLVEIILLPLLTLGVENGGHKAR